MTKVMIGALMAQVGRLQEAIRALQACEQDEVGLPEPAAQAMEDAKTEMLRLPQRRVKAPTTKAATGIGRKLLEACANLEEPFDQQAVFSSLRGSVQLKSVGWNLKYLAKMGRLKCVEKGAPHHAPKFRITNKGRLALGDVSRGPKAVPEERVTIPGLDGKANERTRDTVERELEEACAERDRSRGNGREAMAIIMQSKVDKLQKELDAF